MKMSILPVLVVVAVLAVTAAWSTGPTRAGQTCSNSYAKFGWLTGTWGGSWTNLDFLNTGDVSIEVVLNPNCTGQATIDGVIFQPPGEVVELEFHDDGEDVVLETSADPNFGTTTIRVTPEGALTISGTGLAPGQMGPETVEGTGTITRNSIHLAYTIGLFGGDEADETMELEHLAPLYYGDVNCDGTPNELDALALFLHSAGLDFPRGFDCPEIADDFPPLWGDLNCDDLIDTTDALALLMRAGGLPFEEDGDCPNIGQRVMF